ncbi:MAG: nuclear transport factor 2 family protein [Bryobacteraceae bacterium]|jgi:ketosteroid isomerase-like protein
MTQEIAYRFIQALSTLEQSGEVEPIVAVFSELCEIGTPAIPEKVHGKERARDFWTAYRTAFRNVHSTFRNIVIGNHSIALEWTTTGVNRSGKDIHYEGVTILDIVGTQITHLRTYFDSRVIPELFPQLARAASAR